MILLTTYPATITFSDIVINVVFWVVVLAIYRSRNKTEHNMKMWRAVQIFFAVLLVTLGANYIKRSVKDWWNK